MNSNQTNKNIFIEVNSKLWSSKDLEMVKLVSNLVVPEEMGACIKLSKDNEMKKLNYYWRGLDKSTNVLSFSSNDCISNKKSSYTYLGDIILAYETISLEAKEYKIPRCNHIAHLVVHGLLHLMNFNHEELKEAEIMEKEEVRILSLIGIVDPYMCEANE